MSKQIKLGYLATLNLGESGVSRKQREVSDERVGDGREITNQSDMKITNVAAHAEAKGLMNIARGLLLKNSVRIAGSYFCDEVGFTALQADMADLARKISAHNYSNPDHAIKVALQGWPLEVTGARAVKLAGEIFAEVEETLLSIETCARLGEFDEAIAILNANKNLSAVCPMIVATLIDDALEEVRAGVKAARAELRDEERHAVKLGRSYSGDPAGKGRAMNLGKLDAAIGWVTTREESGADTGATQSQANA